MYESGTIRIFQVTDNPTGHSTTNYESYLSSSPSSPHPPIRCFESNRYEPYLVVPYCPKLTPLYDVRFSGYGKNKISNVLQLRHMNYSFRVASEGFLVHVPHPISGDKVKWEKGGSGEHAEMDRIYVEFGREVKRR